MKDVRIGDYVFRCEDGIEVARAMSLFTKEPGTLAWLDQVQPRDVVWDIGANIGLYTVVAAKRGAQVCAFEPSPANAAALLRNIQANGVADQVRVLTVALSDQDGVAPFAMLSLRAGASGHQIGAFGGAVARELKVTMRGDRLIETGVLNPPTLIKLDVDGQEPAILRGLWNTLTNTPPRSLQVEIQPETRKVVPDLLEPLGYRFFERHDTRAGAQRIQAGADPDTVAHNAIFERS